MSGLTCSWQSEGKRTHLFLLNGLIDQEGSAERSLLGNLDKRNEYCPRSNLEGRERATDLFRLHGVGELGREGNMCDRDVVEHDVEA